MKKFLSMFCLLVFVLTGCAQSQCDFSDTTTTTESNLENETPTTDNNITEVPDIPLNVPIIDKEPYTAWVYEWTLTDHPDFSDYEVDFYSIFSSVIYDEKKESIEYEIDGKVYTCEYIWTEQGNSLDLRLQSYRWYSWKENVGENGPSSGRLYFDCQTGQLVAMYRRIDTTLDDGKTKIFSEEECKQIALDFIDKHVLAYESYVNLDDYQLNESGLRHANEGTEYERWVYYFTFRRYVDGYLTPDEISVGVSQYGTIAEYERGEDCSDLEEWKNSNNVDYQKAKNAVGDVLFDLFGDGWKTGTILEPRYIKLYNGIYGLEYAYLYSEKGLVFFVPLA